MHCSGHDVTVHDMPGHPIVASIIEFYQFLAPEKHVFVHIINTRPE